LSSEIFVFFTILKKSSLSSVYKNIDTNQYENPLKKNPHPMKGEDFLL
jgi:hypothetical protein